MQFRSMLWLLSASLTISLLQGCGGSGGGPSGSPSHGPRGYSHHSHNGNGPSIPQYARGTLTSDGYSRSQRKNYFIQNPVSSIVKNLPIPPGLTGAEVKRLVDAETAFIEAYKNSTIDYLPDPEDLILAIYADKEAFKNIRTNGLYFPDISHTDKLADYVDFDTFIKAMDALTKDLQQNNDRFPSINKHNVLTRSGHHQWQLHYKTMADIRKQMNGEYRFNDLKDDMPMVADASGNNVLESGLEYNEWYFYGQGYAFRGHWQPDTNTRQNYKGHGMELGLLKTIDSGWAFGGMFGLQKVNMEASQSKADAMIYRAGPFISWSDDRWSLDTMLTYGWVNMNTTAGRWNGTPKGNEWAGHVQGTYAIALDNWAMGLKLIPEAYAGYRVGNIKAYDEKNGIFTRHIASSKQTGLTTRVGTGLNYTFPNLNNPTDVLLRVGLEKSFMWQKDQQDRRSQWPRTPSPESRETAVYYGLGFNHQFGADLDKLIGIDYLGTSGKNSGSDALTFTYRQRF